MSNLEKGGATHQFRKASCQAMAERDINILDLQKIMGHADIKNTFFYFDLSVKKIKDAHKKFHPK